MPTDTLIVTTVHDLRVVTEQLPETEHDFRADRIVSPTRVVRVRRGRRPPGILWSHLDEAKTASVPPLARLAAARR